MTSEYKEYIDTTDPTRKVRCDIYYFKERKKYSASVTLVTIEDDNTEMRTESFVLYQDSLNHSLLTVPRKSQKATDQAIEIFRQVKDTLVNTLLKGRDVTLLT